jgi:hypothetical protein
MEKFITNGKLIHFVGEHKAQYTSGRSREQPRDPQQFVAREFPPRNTWPWENHPQEHPRHHDRGREEGRSGFRERARENRRSRSQSQCLHEPKNQEVVAKIRTIARGFTRGGDSQTSRKAYARQAKVP